jgi:hypothetical protein
MSISSNCLCAASSCFISSLCTILATFRCSADHRLGKNPVQLGYGRNNNDDPRRSPRSDPDFSKFYFHEGKKGLSLELNFCFQGTTFSGCSKSMDWNEKKFEG